MATPPRFRTGHRVKLNVYDNDEPAFQAHSEHKAAVYVALLNAGERVETITRAELSAVFADSGEWWDDENFLHRLEAEVWALFTSRETPVERPESPTEGPPATGQRPTTYDLTEGQEFRKAIADAERGALEAIDPLAVPFLRRADDDPPVRRVAISICQPCLDGEGSECHTPGCALWMHRVDLRIDPVHYEVLES